MNLKHLLDSVNALAISGKETVTQSSLEAAGIKGITLRDYQIYGVSWLKECASQKRGGILCDEMGLGKTCQVIAFLASILHESMSTSVLIVTPLSVIHNWEAELTKFYPSVKFLLYVGDQNTRAEMRTVFSPQKFPVLLTSFEICLNDEEFFEEYSWKILVVDEGHRLKNSEALIYSALNDMCKNLRFILTGTPVQNNLFELYNLLHFVAPKYFPMNTRSEFVNYFGSDSADWDTLEATMTKLLRPFLLRRTKRQVLPHLPPRLDLLLYHSLSPIQTQIYRALLTKNADVLSAVVSSTTKSTAPSYKIENLVMHLRKCVNHPYLFDGVEPEPFVLGQHLIDASGKLVLLDSLLAYLCNPWSTENCSENGTGATVRPPVHKVLVFSQMTRMLDIIQDYLTLRDYTYERLDGSIRGEDRHTAVKGFNENEDVFIFLLSTKAGGQGLNLVAADTVILVDSDFNPQNDLQAAARIHRIGQNKPIRIIRLVGRNTVEEAILSRADAKLKLTSRVLGSVDAALSVDDDPGTASVEEVINVAKFGLARLFNDMDLSDEAETDTPLKVATVTSDFTKILGETDPTTGHWLEPSLDLDQTEQRECGFVLLTDKPFACTVSEADKLAIAKLKEEHDAALLLHETETSMLDQTEVDTAAGSYRTRNQRVTESNTQAIVPRAPLTAEQLAERAKRKAELAEARKLKADEARAKRQAAKLEKRRALWDSVGYRSLSVYRDEVQEELANETERASQGYPCGPASLNSFDIEFHGQNDAGAVQPGIYYKVGDASKPLMRFAFDATEDAGQSVPYQTPAFVCISVDDSGGWGTGGFFRAIDQRSAAPAAAYELAGTMDDLELGDCHLVPVIDPSIPNSDQLDVRTFADWLLTEHEHSSTSVHDQIRANFCGLLVAQKHTRRSQSSGGPPDLQLQALDRALSALGMACRSLKQCSVHIPRLGQGTHAFIWYSVERLLRKHLVERSGCSVFVYYYHRSVASPAVAQSHSGSADLSRKRVQSDKSDVLQRKQQKTTGYHSRHLINLFSGKVFYLHCPSSLEDQVDEQTEFENNSSSSLSNTMQRLKRLIVAYDGDLSSIVHSSVTHVVSLGSVHVEANELSKAEPYELITPAWIEASVSAMKCPPESDYRP